MKNIDNRLFDKRVIRRCLEQELLKKEEYKKYIESLPDDSENMDIVNLDNLLNPPPDEPFALSPLDTSPVWSNNDK